MTVKRTADVELDQPFEYVCDVTKASVDPVTGRRLIRGVASGIAEDRAGERVSKAAIVDMARQATVPGALALTSSHDQDWLTTFGRVDKLEHDREHDELLYEASLPPEGEDPIADKAWRSLTVDGKKLGVSIGGRLKKAYYELVDGKGGVRKRKVLDGILLRHLALTEKPCYTGAFAEAVAKTFEGDAPADDAFTLEADADEDLDVGKAKPADDDDQAAEQQAAAPDANPDPAADAPTGEDGQDQPPAASADAPTDAQDTQQLPMARHLSCPNCGHEFAAPMPKDGPDDSPGAEDNANDEDDEADARKSHQENTTMDPIQDTVAKLRALAEGEEVAKTDEPKADAPAAADVEKTEAKTEGEPELTPVEKMVAASHRANTDAIAALTTQVGEAFGLVTKALVDVQEAIAKQPQGRKSVARVVDPAHRVSDATQVEKTAPDSEAEVMEQVAKTDDPVAALKLLNAHRYGVR